MTTVAQRGEFLPTTLEMAQQVTAEARRAEVERLRAEIARMRAEGNA